MYSFPNLELVYCSMSSSNCCFLTCIQISQEAGQMVWYSHLFKNFPFQILKDDAVKVLHSICQQSWKTQQWPQNWKRSVFIPIPKKGNTKECSDYCTIAFISHASKVMLKILQARLQQFMNHELPDVQAGFRKGRRSKDQIVNICLVIEKVRELQKNTYFCFIGYAKVLSNSVKLWAMLCRATQDRQVMVESSDKTWSTGEGNCKPLQYSCLENPMNSMNNTELCSF